MWWALIIYIFYNQMSQLFMLYESASGYCLFEKEEFDETGGQLSKIQKAIMDL